MAKTYEFTEVEYRIIKHCMTYTLINREMSEREKEYIQTVKDKLQSRHDTRTN